MPLKALVETANSRFEMNMQTVETAQTVWKKKIFIKQMAAKERGGGNTNDKLPHQEPSVNEPVSPETFPMIFFLSCQT